MSETPGGPWTSHGHEVAGVTVTGSGRPPVARCGGPALCQRCALEAEQIRVDALESLSYVIDKLDPVVSRDIMSHLWGVRRYVAAQHKAHLFDGQAASKRGERYTCFNGYDHEPGEDGRCIWCSISLDGSGDA